MRTDNDASEIGPVISFVTLIKQYVNLQSKVIQQVKRRRQSNPRMRHLENSCYCNLQ